MGAQLAIDIAQMHFHRVPGKPQAAGDRADRPALRDFADDLPFALGECRDVVHCRRAGDDGTPPEQARRKIRNDAQVAHAHLQRLRPAPHQSTQAGAFLDKGAVPAFFTGKLQDLGQFPQGGALLPHAIECQCQQQAQLQPATQTTVQLRLLDRRAQHRDRFVKAPLCDLQTQPGDTRRIHVVGEIEYLRSLPIAVAVHSG
ncbi:hypothetical protein D3C76_1176480 [compost metagenome]